MVFCAGSVHAQFLKVGPIYWSGQVDNTFTATSNADNLSKREAEDLGLEREDFYIQLAVTLNAEGNFYPDIDLSFSVTLDREWHFIQPNLEDSETPFLGDAIFDFNRQLGHMNFLLTLNHNANTTAEETEVFVPEGELLVRDFIQQSQANAQLDYTRKTINVNGGYTFDRIRHEEEFEQGDSDTQTLTLNVGYTPIDRVSGDYTYNRTRNELINPVPGSLTNSDWLETQSATMTYRIMERPLLEYIGGLEKEDDRLVLGTWDIIHGLNISDSREPFQGIQVNYNAQYNYDEEEEEDDINFTYGATVQQTINKYMSHNVSLTRTPVETFGSTVDSDATDITYTYQVNNLIFQGLSATATATYTRTEPKGERAGPVEDQTLYSFTVNKIETIPWSRKLNASLNYSYFFEVSDERDAYDTHMLSLLLSYQL